MTNDLLEDDQSSPFSRSELLSVIICFLLIGLFTSVDVFQDWSSHIPINYIIPEILIALFCIISITYLFIRFTKSRSRSLAVVKGELRAAKQMATDWQTQAEKLKQGVGEAITAQLERWGLSHSEQEISFLLIKGLSTKEIAQLRETTEGTIRFQCSVIYKKSGLQGRAQLAAFFLEDLLAR